MLISGVALFITQCEKEPELNPEDPVDIPDSNLLAALIEAGADTNGDSLISYAEAEMVTLINVSGKWRQDLITDMTGIEKFVNLDTLICDWNQIVALDISNNTALQDLMCSQNQLTSLDVSVHTALERFYCGNNLLSSLDISKNEELRDFRCGNNHLTNLDVSNNTALVILDCANNQLTELDVTNLLDLHIMTCGDNQLASLDLSNNSRMGPIEHLLYPSCELDIGNMPTLEEVCVWTMPFPPEGFKLCMDGSPNVYFTTGCSQ